MPRLYTYCIPYDHGSAPNPYWGVCTLVICKPAIRRAADVGDWIVGTGSVGSPIGDVSGCVVYAMRVSNRMTLAEYQAYAAVHLPGKIYRSTHRDERRRLGDALYDFSTDPPTPRRRGYSEGDVMRDLSGRNALLSDHFYYFGDQPVRLPEDLQCIVHQRSGHRSDSNAPHLRRFVEWIEGLGLAPGTLVGQPQLGPVANGKRTRGCAIGRCRKDSEDEEIRLRAVGCVGRNTQNVCA